MKRKALLFVMMLCLACFGVANAQTLNEGFEGSTFPPTDWTTIHVSGTNAWARSTGTGANSSSAFAYRKDVSGGYEDYLITPLLEPKSGEELSFYLASQYSASYPGTTLTIEVSTTTPTVAAFTTVLATYTSGSSGTFGTTGATDWVNKTVGLSAYVGQQIYIAFHAKDTGYNADTRIDNVSGVSLFVPACPKPTNLEATTDGATATLTWEGTAANGFIVNVNGTDYSGQTSPYTFNVALSTTYNVTVTADCGGGDTSDPVSTSFTTPDCVGGRTINYTLTDSYGDGWNGNAIQVYEGCGNLIATLTIEDGSSETGSLTLCGDYYEFIWVNGSYASETSFTFTEGGTTLFTKPSSVSDGQVLYTIGTTTPIPTALTAGTPDKNSVDLGWTENGTASAWEICVNGDETNPVPANTNPFTLGSLTPDTDYTIKVRAYIDATHQSCWSDEITVHTAIACARPEDLTASKITANSIDLTWTGDHEKYDVRYIETIPTTDFEEGLGAWTTIDADGDGFTWLYSETGVQGHNGGSCAYSMSYDNDGGAVLFPDNYLVSPKVQLGGTISFYATNQDYRFPEYIGVAVSTTSNTNPTAFTNIFGETLSSTAKTQGDWIHITVDLGAFSGEGYVAIRHYNCSDGFYLDVDDITITVPDNAAWNYKNNLTNNKCTIDNLAGNTTYAIQVRGYCQGETEPSNWCNAITATTVNGNIFQTAGNWNVAANWAGGEVPAAGSDVIIAANVIVPATYVADAGNITFENSAAITVAEGGQLKTTASGVNATMLKHIDAANNWSTASEGWNFIAYPVIGSGNPSTLGMIASEATQYDLYYFDLNCNGTYGDYGVIETEGDDNNEWRNYKKSTFTLDNGQGYLYANANPVDLSFTGELNPTNANVKVLMHYSANARFQGVNLLGNPYSCNAYIADGRDFYVLDADGKEVMKSANNFIAPMQAVLVEATAIGNLNFTTTAPSKGRVLNMSLSNRNALVDNAAIRFDEGEGLSKFQLNPNHTKIYIEQDNKDYAVVHSAEQGEMPVNFKAEKNGTYTLSFSTENIEMGYLHLIDNLTGNDVDLLATPSYSFEANTTDYASRFRLVFSAGNANDSQFAFISNGEIVLNGQGTAQVYDITGRMISSHYNATRIATENMAAGVYVIRLINGENVKTQKIIVK